MSNRLTFRHCLTCTLSGRCSKTSQRNGDGWRRSKCCLWITLRQTVCNGHHCKLRNCYKIVEQNNVLQNLLWQVGRNGAVTWVTQKSMFTTSSLNHLSWRSSPGQQTTTGIAKGWYTSDVYDEELGPGRIEAKPTPSPASAASGNRQTTALEIGIGEYNVGTRLIKSRGLRQASTQRMLATQSWRICIKCCKFPRNNLDHSDRCWPEKP